MRNLFRKTPSHLGYTDDNICLWWRGFKSSMVKKDKVEYLKWQQKQIAMLKGIYAELLDNEKRLKSLTQTIDKSEKT